MKKIIYLIISFILIMLVSSIAFYTIPRVLYKVEDDYSILYNSYGNVKNYEAKDFYKSKQVEEIAEKAFYNSNSLEEFVCSKYIKECYKLSFAECKKLKVFTFNNEMIYPGNNMFKNDYLLEKVIFPTDSVLEEISGSMFYGCKSIKSLELPNSIDTIGSFAFYGCDSLEELNVSSKLSSIEINSFLGLNLKRLIIRGNEQNYLNWISYFEDSKTEIIYK